MNQLRSSRILVAEDDAFAREEMEYFLSKRADKVFTAPDGKKAWELFQMHSPDIVIADLLMPRMGGMELVQTIRESDHKGHTPIVIVTSVNDVETVLTAVNIGVEGYIVKPIDFNELEVKLMKIADQLQADKSGSADGLEALPDRREREDRIKKMLASMLKKTTGKGFREAIVQLKGDIVSITAFETLTTLEETLASSRKNEEVLHHVRRMVYDTIRSELEMQIGEIVRQPVELEGIDISFRKRMEVLKFRIKNNIG